MASPLLEKSLDFATQIVLFYEVFSKAKKDTNSPNNFFALPPPSVPTLMRQSTETAKLILSLSCILH